MYKDSLNIIIVHGRYSGTFGSAVSNLITIYNSQFSVLDRLNPAVVSNIL
jgi:hypothetical protein